MSKPVTIDIPHQLGTAEARRRLEEGLGRLGSQLPGGMAAVHQHWTDDRLSFSAEVMGQGISGYLDVMPDRVRMDVMLPGFLAMLAGKIKGRVQQEGQALLEKKP